MKTADDYAKLAEKYILDSTVGHNYASLAIAAAIIETSNIHTRTSINPHTHPSTDKIPASQEHG